ncbi:MAG: hypothetical protein AB8G05_16370 [Oligoflexales bacterium]
MTIKDLRVVLVLFFGLIVSISTFASVSNASTSLDETIELDTENQDSSPEEEEFLARSDNEEESQAKGNLFTYCYKNPGYCTAVAVGAIAIVGVGIAGCKHLIGYSSDTTGMDSKKAQIQKNDNDTIVSIVESDDISVDTSESESRKSINEIDDNSISPVAESEFISIEEIDDDSIFSVAESEQNPSATNPSKSPIVPFSFISFPSGISSNIRLGNPYSLTLYQMPLSKNNDSENHE